MSDRSDRAQSHQPQKVTCPSDVVDRCSTTTPIVKAASGVHGACLAEGRFARRQALSLMRLQMELVVPRMHERCKKQADGPWTRRARCRCPNSQRPDGEGWAVNG